MRSVPFLRRFRRGTAAMEFALLLPVIATMTSAIVDFSWFMSRSYNIQRVTRDSARIAATVYESSDDLGTDSVAEAREHADRVFDALGMDCSGDCEIEVTYNADGFRTITVAVRYPHTPLIGLVPVSEFIESSFTMAVENQ